MEKPPGSDGLGSSSPGASPTRQAQDSHTLSPSRLMPPASSIKNGHPSQPPRRNPIILKSSSKSGTPASKRRANSEAESASNDSKDNTTGGSTAEHETKDPKNRLDQDGDQNMEDETAQKFGLPMTDLHSTDHASTEPCVKRERSPDAFEEEASVSTRMKTEPSDAGPSNSDEAPFAFLHPLQDNAERLIIKEGARDAAIKSVLEAKKLLIGEVSGAGEEDADGAKDIVQRIDQMLEKNRTGKKVMVGVCGGTGVGKTSTLNAILGFNELLPSGQEEATTAVPCMVAQNEDDREGHECRAEVLFQDKDSIREDLRKLLRVFAQRADAEDHGQTSDLREYTTVIRCSMDRFSPVWDLDEEEIERRLFGEDDGRDDPGQSTWDATQQHDSPSEDIQAQEDRQNATLDWIFSLNEDVNKLLTDGVLSMAESTPERLAKEMKKYLDSTEGLHGRETSRKFAAWPLVKEVHVFVKSELLASGVCLVDLPGIGDNNRSRNSVAGSYMSRLDLTIVVASVARGKDTRDFNDVLSAQQETTMKLDGTLNKDRFAIVFTKIDDIQPEKYHFHNASDGSRHAKFSRIASDHAGQSERLVQEISRAEKAISKAQKKMSRKPALDPAVVEQEKVIKKVQQKLVALSKEQGRASVCSEVAGQMATHIAIVARNQYVQSCILRSFAERQRTQTRRRRGGRRSTGAPASAQSPQSPPVQQQIAQVFMTSSRGYEKLANKREPLPGVPSERFTGIPAVKQWIQKNAALNRETCLDDILSDLRVLLELITAWVQAGSKSSTALRPRATLKEAEEALEGVHQAQLVAHSKIINDACNSVDKIDPLGDRARMAGTAPQRMMPIVEGFVRKYPGDPTNLDPMHHSTYNAIIAHGGSFRSPTTEQSYDWILRLGVPYAEGLVPTWQTGLTQGTQEMVHNTLNLIAGEWISYADAILAEMAKLDPVLRTALADIATAMKASHASFGSDVQSISHEFYERTTRMHHEAIGPSLATIFGEIIDKVSKITGNGSFRERQEFLREEALRESERLFRGVWSNLTKILKKNQTQAKRSLRALPAKVMREVKAVIRLRLKALISHEAGDTVSEMAHLVHKWKQNWTFPPTNNDHVFKQKLGIPETLCLQDLGKDHPVFSFGGVNYFDVIKNNNAGPETADHGESLDDLLGKLAL